MSEDVQQKERVPQQSGSLTMTVSFRCAVMQAWAGTMYIIYTLNVCLWTATLLMYHYISLFSRGHWV